MSRSRSSSPDDGKRLSDLLDELSAAAPMAAAEQLARPRGSLAQALLDQQVDRAQLIIDRYESKSRTPLARRREGVFYTPSSIVAAMLDRLPTAGEWLDPAAGAGAFLVALARRHGAPILNRLTACDVDGEALDVAALALEAALGGDCRKDIAKWRRTRAHERDFLREDHAEPRPDIIVGNPPYGLDGGEDLVARFADLRGEADLYAAFLLRAAEIMKPSGTMALLVPDSWLTNQRAAGLRAALASRGVARIVDFGKPFATARDTRVHAVFLKGGSESCAVESLRESTFVPLAPTTRETLAGNAARGWFLYRTAGEAAACRKIEAAPPLSDLLTVLYGLRTGNNALHVRRGAGAVPLMAGRDLGAFDRRKSSCSLVTSAPFSVAVDRQVGRWKIGIQRIRTNSKLPWRRWVEAALLEPDEVGLDSLTLVADPPGGVAPSEALLHALGVLNSSVLNRWYRLTFTDVNVKPRYIESVPIPPVDPRVAGLVRQRLDRPGDVELERAIDRLVAHGYGLNDEEVECLEAGFWGDARRPLPSLESARDLAA